MKTHLPPHTYFPAQRSRPGASVPIPGKATDAQIRQWVETMRLDLIRFARLNDRECECSVDANGLTEDGDILSLADMAEMVCGPGMLDLPSVLFCPTCGNSPHTGSDCPTCPPTDYRDALLALARIATDGEARTGNPYRHPAVREAFRLLTGDPFGDLPAG